MTATAKQWTINDIQTAMRANGSHWWDPDTMRFFGTRVSDAVLQGPGGIYFVSSEYTGFDRTGRGYTVRKFNPDTCDIDREGDLGQFASRSGALNAARKFAGEGATCTTEAFKAVTILEQFVHDCRTHGNGSATKVDCKLMIKLARRWDVSRVNLCNGLWEHDENGDEPKPLQRLRKRIIECAKRLGANGVILEGDPRGCTVKLTWPDGETNDFGKEGWCVPAIRQ